MPAVPTYSALNDCDKDELGHKPRGPMFGRGWDSWNRTRRGIAPAPSAIVTAIDLAGDGSVTLTLQEGDQPTRVQGWNHHPHGIRQALGRSRLGSPRWLPRWRLLRIGETYFHLSEAGPSPCASATD